MDIEAKEVRDAFDYDVPMPKSAILLTKSPLNDSSAHKEMISISNGADHKLDSTAEMSFFKTTSDNSEPPSFEDSSHESSNHIEDIQVSSEDSSINQLPNSAKILHNSVNSSNLTNNSSKAKSPLPKKRKALTLKSNLFNCMRCTRKQDSVDNDLIRAGEVVKPPIWQSFLPKRFHKRTVYVIDNASIPDELPGDGGGAIESLLGPLEEKNKNKKCFIIDLDETLVHSSFKQIENSDFEVDVDLDGSFHKVYVLKRPYVDEFLTAIGDLYECVLFTASLAKYADPVIDFIDPKRVFQKRLFRDSCVNHFGNYVKDLRLLGREENSVVILDNSPISYFYQPTHAVQIVSWFDDPNDRALLELIPYFVELADPRNKEVPAFLQMNHPPLPHAAIGTVGIMGSNTNLYSISGSYGSQSNNAGGNLKTGNYSCVIASVPGPDREYVNGVSTPLSIQTSDKTGSDFTTQVSRRPLMKPLPAIQEHPDATHEDASCSAGDVPVPLTIATSNAEFAEDTRDVMNPETGLVDHLSSTLSTHCTTVTNKMLDPQMENSANEQTVSTPRLSISETNQMLREQFFSGQNSSK